MKVFNNIKYCIIFSIIYIILFHYVIIPIVIEKRSKDLNLLKFKSTENKLVEKDSIFISGYELHYLKTGSFDNYKGY